MAEQNTGLKQQIQQEISDYFTKEVNISDNYSFSQPKLIQRIIQFDNRIYPTGKVDGQKKYKFFYDIISPRVSSEVKNIDFDTKNIRAKSDRVIDGLLTIITNLKMKFWLRLTGQSEELNSALEEGSGWGNVVWKKVKGGYERVDLKNFYVINQSAKTLNETPVIERHQMSQSDLRAKTGYKNLKEVLSECKSNMYSTSVETTATETTTPYYDIYERNGEVCLKDLKEERNEKVEKGDENKYVLAKVIVAGQKAQSTSSVEIKYILFADTISKMPYKEYHRGTYKGRWFREGLIELLFDCQVRTNQIGNQIAKGLEWASKVIFRHGDKLVVQNILIGLRNGDIIKSADLAQVEVRLQGFDQLANDWNRTLELANDIANSREVVMGNALPSGTPLGAYNQLNANANKLYTFLQEKFAIPVSEMFEEWLIPGMLDDLKLQDVINLSGDTEMLNRAREIFVNDWYLKNALYLPPHNKEIADTLKASKMEELKKRPQLLMKNFKDMFDDFKKNVYVDITGEKQDIDSDLQTLTTILGLEADPIRRSFIMDKILKEKGFDPASFPKAQLQQPSPQPIQSTKQPSPIVA
jgi:hypothetical protein